MGVETNSRRQLIRIAATVALAAPTLAATVDGAQAYQGNMEHAIGALRNALRLLRQATPDKGGHKAKAVGLVEQAIGEVQAGIDYAARRFGD